MNKTGKKKSCLKLKSDNGSFIYSFESRHLELYTRACALTVITRILSLKTPYPRGLRFHVPQEKGSVVSGDGLVMTGPHFPHFPSYPVFRIRNSRVMIFQVWVSYSSGVEERLVRVAIGNQLVSYMHEMNLVRIGHQLITCRGTRKEK